MRTRKGLLWGVAAAALMMTGTAGLASTIASLDFTNLVSQSETIVIGKVKRTFTAQQGDLVFTYALVQVEEGLTAAAERDEVMIVVPGGVFENKGVRVYGLTAPQVDERAVFFLKKSQLVMPAERSIGPTAYEIVGFGQGRFPVLTDAASGKEMVFSPREVGLTKLNLKYSVSSPLPAEAELSSFLHKIKQEAARRTAK